MVKCLAKVLFCFKVWYPILNPEPFIWALFLCFSPGLIAQILLTLSLAGTVSVLFWRKNAYLGFPRSVSPDPKPVTLHRMSFWHILTVSACHRTIQYRCDIIRDTVPTRLRCQNRHFFAPKMHNLSPRPPFSPIQVKNSRLLSPVDASYQFRCMRLSHLRANGGPVT